MATLSARDFNRDVSAAKRAAKHEPVFITDRGTPSHVLLAVEEYQAMLSAGKSLLEAFAPPKEALGSDVDFEPERMTFQPRVPEL